jgi:hypothetical protein
LLPAGVAPNPDNTATSNNGVNGANFTEFTDPEDFDNTTALNTGNATNADNSVGANSNGEANTTAAAGNAGNTAVLTPASPAPNTAVIGGGDNAEGAGQLTGTVDPIPGGNTGEGCLIGWGIWFSGCLLVVCAGSSCHAFVINTSVVPKGQAACCS